MKYSVHGYEDNEVIKNFEEYKNDIIVEMLNGDTKRLPNNSKEDIIKEQRKQSFDFSKNLDSYAVGTVFQLLLAIFVIIVTICNISIIAFDALVEMVGLIGIIPWLVGVYIIGNPIVKKCNKVIIKIYEPKMEQAVEKAKHNTYLKYEKAYENTKVNLNTIDNYTIDDLKKIREKLNNIEVDNLTTQDNLEKPKVKTLKISKNK